MISPQPPAVEEKAKPTATEAKIAKNGLKEEQEVINLTLDGNTISSNVLTKKSKHGEASIANEFEFDLSNLDNSDFEKVLLSDLMVNNIFQCSILFASVKPKTKSVTVKFYSGLSK
jgi:hypothetical protein